MDSRLRVLTLIAVVPVLLLIAFMAGLFYSQWSTPPQTVVPPTFTRAPTDIPTFTPTPSETPFVIAFPSPAPTATPTATRPPTATATRTVTPSPSPVPTGTRVPTRTATPSPVPTATEVGGQYRFRPEGAPSIFRDRSCQAQNIIFGYVKGRDGKGLPGILLRFVPKYGRPPELPGITREAPDAGYYELTVGTSGNEWEIFLVDGSDAPMSPTVTFVVQQQESGECWWLLNWIER